MVSFKMVFFKFFIWKNFLEFYSKNDVCEKFCEINM